MKPRWGKNHLGIITRRRCWRTNTGLNAEIPLGFFRTVVPFAHFAAFAAFARRSKTRHHRLPVAMAFLPHF